ncbi:MAG: hypothetical protein JWO12_2923 [Frankiales bacterium]|nr:hypothetical protein [Frankiales bacterium]
MVISTVDQGLAALLRVALPLPEETGDISFDVPDRSWGSQLSRITVNLYLFDVASSAQPPRPAQDRVRADGRVERRARLPMVQLSYMVTAWAGSVPDEHQLLSECLSLFVSHQVLPADLLPEPLAGSVQLALAQREGRRPGDLWSGLEGRMKPVLELQVTLPVETEPWVLAPPAVERIAGLVAPTPDEPAADPRRPRTTAVRRAPDGSLSAVPIGGP